MPLNAGQGAVQIYFSAVLRSAFAQCDVICRTVGEVYQTLSGSGSSQWDVLQTVQEGSQLTALLTSGDFIVLPLGARPYQSSQVSPTSVVPEHVCQSDVCIA